MNYCKNCGEGVTQKATRRFECPSCGNIYYINPKGATALLLLNSKGKLVLGRRALDPHKGKLDCFGGFVDVGENFERGMFRELQEEAGLQELDISELEYVGSTYDPYDWQSRVVPTVSVYFRATLREGAAPTSQATEDIGSVETVDVSDIKREDVAWEGMWEMIQRLKKEL